MPTVVRGGIPGPHSGKGGGGAERRRNDGQCSHVARAVLVNEAVAGLNRSDHTRSI